MLGNPTWAAVYAPRGYLLVEGDYVERLHYGKTLERIAEHGASAFYEGEVAENSVKTIQASGGIMTLDDVRELSLGVSVADTNQLRDFKALRYPAIHQTYHNRTIYTTSAPGS